MCRLISSLDQAIHNIIDFQSFIESSQDITERLAMHRAWYAYKVEGVWHFGSSKIIGYSNMTPLVYLRGGLDGRQTEATLQKWFTEIGPGEPLYGELWEKLSEFLANYGKNPSRLARINIPHSEVPSAAGANTEALCDLIIEVAKGLKSKDIADVRKRLKRLL